MYTILVQYDIVYNAYTICIPLNTICVQYLYNVCSIPVEYECKMYTIFVQCVYNTCTSSAYTVHTQSTTRVQYVYTSRLKKLGFLWGDAALQTLCWGAWSPLRPLCTLGGGAPKTPCILEGCTGRASGRMGTTKGIC